jgi:hypothetical protein
LIIITFSRHGANYMQKRGLRNRLANAPFPVGTQTPGNSAQEACARLPLDKSVQAV